MGQALPPSSNKMATSRLSITKPLHLTKESRQALIQYISILRSPSNINCMPTPECLWESMDGRFGDILYIEEFLAGGKQGLFVTFASRTSRDEFIAFTRKLKDPTDPLFTIRGTDRSVDAFSLLGWYHIPSSLEKILTRYGLLEFMPGFEVSSKNPRSSTHSAIPKAPKSFATKNTSWRSDSVTDDTSSIPSPSSFPKLPSRPDMSTSALLMRTSPLETKAATDITPDKLWRTMSSPSLPMHPGYQTPLSNSDSQTWGWTTRKTAFAPEGFELDTSSVYSGNRQKSVATAQDISPRRAAPQTSVATVSTPRPSNAFSPIQWTLPPTVDSSTAQLNVQNPKVKVEDFFPDISQSQDTGKDAATDPSYLDVRNLRVALKTSHSELRVTQKKLDEAERVLDEIRLQAAINKTRLTVEKNIREETEKKVKELQDEVKALSSSKKGEAKFSDVEVQTLSLTAPQKPIQMDQKRPVDHASTQTEIENPDSAGDSMELEELREGGVENESELDQPKVAYAEGLEEKQGGMEMKELERDSELKRHSLVHEQKLAESSTEIEWLRNRQKESEDALQQQRKDHAEQLAELRGEMETRKIEALATQFPAASKLLIAAYIRLEGLGKRKREDGEEEI